MPTNASEKGATAQRYHAVQTDERSRGEGAIVADESKRQGGGPVMLLPEEGPHVTAKKPAQVPGNQLKDYPTEELNPNHRDFHLIRHGLRGKRQHVPRYGNQKKRSAPTPPTIASIDVAVGVPIRMRLPQRPSCHH